MPFPIEQKLVIAVASSALFDLSESGRVFEVKGEEEYRKYQRKNQNQTLEKGVAFPFIRRFLGLNDIFSDEQPVEVVLLSHNDPDTGLRVFNSIRDHCLNITRAGFLSGGSPFRYIPAFNVSLFLSAKARDVKKAINAGHPAGTVIGSEVDDDTNDSELRVAFDFDGVLASDEAEIVYAEHESVEEFHRSESELAGMPLEPGLLKDLLAKLSNLQQLEIERKTQDLMYKRVLRTAIVTARNAPAHERVVTTLRDWGINVDETFFLGGIEKKRVLDVLQPHIFFDDQMSHLQSVAGNIPSVHIPFGIRNQEKERDMAYQINLPHGASGEGFKISDLVEHIKRSHMDYIIQGQVNCNLSDHPKPSSLDVWIRENHTARKDTKQATNDLLQDILETGMFEEGKFQCPDSGRKCKGLALKK